MSRIVSIVCLLAVLCFAIPPASASAAAPALPSANCVTYTLADRETYVICIPKIFWNRDLVVFAHGYEFDLTPNLPPRMGDEQWNITLDNGTTITLPQLVNALGFGFAATSYSKDGLAVLEGVDQMKALVAAVRAKYPGVRNVYIVGASEGGLITTLSMERNPETYKGGLALCGPIGDFQGQVNYWGDFRALYDALFPGTLPPDAVNIPPELIADWANPESVYRATIAGQLVDPNNVPKFQTLLGLSKAPIDPANLATIGETTFGILTYNVFATDEARAELGGFQPYDNSARIDGWQPLPVTKYEALPSPELVAAALLPYQTSGKLTKALVTMHTLGDPIVPFWHETGYATKVAMNGASSKLTVLPINRYGHCIFKPAEILFSFALMLYQSNRMPIRMAQYQEVMSGIEPGTFAEFEALNAQFGDLSKTKIFLPVVGGQD